MACCCKGGKSTKANVSCLGRCDLPKHRCLDYEDVKPGPVPGHMGWLYTAKDSPEHQLRCGWRPGHISCAVLRKIERHNCHRASCDPCPSLCSRPPCARPCVMTCNSGPPCSNPCTPCPPGPCSSGPCPPGPCASSPCGPIPLIRIARQGGQYTICTKPSNMDNSPSGPYPLKYVLDTCDDGGNTKGTKYSIEAKFNDNHFDYTSSQTSFVLDFSPPGAPPCPKRSSFCC